MVLLLHDLRLRASQEEGFCAGLPDEDELEDDDDDVVVDEDEFVVVKVLALLEDERRRISVFTSLGEAASHERNHGWYTTSARAGLM